MFERYTEGARRLIFFSRAEAVRLDSNEIETAHLLLAFFVEQTELLARMAPGLTRDTVEAAVNANHRKKWRLFKQVDLPLSKASMRVLERATEEANRLKNRRITPEHLFLGLLRETEGIPSRLLPAGGVTLETGRLRAMSSAFYCPRCGFSTTDPLTCGDCSAVICRVCGTPLESSEELGIG